ncbi:MAG TPA: hypothetical protein VGZ69_04905 [Candidatus Rhabdochlamydia sp.]|jgi:hypothetical protein|nr:hypothetical protein [Candidatus Rhabdochlamydia sp.]
MTYSANISWTSAPKFFVPVLILPYCSKTFTYSNVLICHVLYKLIYKIQECVFKRFFSEIPDPFLQPLSVLFHFPRNKFEVLNSCLATGISFLMLSQVRGQLAEVFIKYRLYMGAFPFVSLFLMTNIFIGFVVARRIYKMVRSHLYPITKPQMTITEENRVKAEKIKNLIAEILSINPNVNEQDLVTEKNLYLLDKVLLGFPNLPIQEKDNPQHLWDIIETIDPLIADAINKGEDLKCPNGCNKKLELGDQVNTNVQDEIINLLKKAIASLNEVH